MAKIGPLENIIGEEISGYEVIPVDKANKVNDQLILEFKSGKKLLLGFMCIKESDSTCRPSYFLGPK